jgi:hypothetical protein
MRPPATLRSPDYQMGQVTPGTEAHHVEIVMGNTKLTAPEE